MESNYLQDKFNQLLRNPGVLAGVVAGLVFVVLVIIFVVVVMIRRRRILHKQAYYDNTTTTEHHHHGSLQGSDKKLMGSRDSEDSFDHQGPVYKPCEVALIKSQVV